jgi:hypothetical protein
MTPSNSPRWFSGYVSRFSWMGRDDVLTRWQVEVVPSLWFTTLTSDCKIFQEKAVPDIVSDVLSDTSEITLSKKITGSHSPWDYCVQYRETDFAFVSRLMEHEGIGYHFEHAQGSLKMVVSDSNSAFTDCKEAEVETAQGFASPATAGVITSWRHEYAFRPGKFVQTDYSFEEPTTSLLATGKGKSSYSNATKAELFDYPGLYDKKPDGDTTAKVRIEAEEATASVASGTSTCRASRRATRSRSSRTPTRRSAARNICSPRWSIGPASAAPTRRRPEAAEAFEYENSFEAVPSRDGVAADPQHALAGGHRADGARRGALRRGDLHRPIRSHQGAVPLGPLRQEERAELLLDPGVAVARRAPVRHAVHSPRRHGGGRLAPRRRPQPPARDRRGLQRHEQAALRAAIEGRPERPADAEHEGRGRRERQPAHLRRHEGVGTGHAARREELHADGRERRHARGRLRHEGQGRPLGQGLQQPHRGDRGQWL